MVISANKDSNSINKMNINSSNFYIKCCTFAAQISESTINLTDFIMNGTTAAHLAVVRLKSNFDGACLNRPINMSSCDKQILLGDNPNVIGHDFAAYQFRKPGEL